MAEVDLAIVLSRVRCDLWRLHWHKVSDWRMIRIMVGAVLSYTLAVFTGIIAASVPMFLLVPLTPLLLRVKPIYPLIMGCLAVLVGGGSGLIATYTLRWLGYAPSALLFGILALGWIQNDVRRVVRSRDPFVGAIERNMLFGHALGVVIAATLTLVGNDAASLLSN